MDPNTPIVLAAAKYTSSRRGRRTAFKTVWGAKHEGEFDHMSAGGADQGRRRQAARRASRQHDQASRVGWDRAGCRVSGRGASGWGRHARRRRRGGWHRARLSGTSTTTSRRSSWPRSATSWSPASQGSSSSPSTTRRPTLPRCSMARRRRSSSKRAPARLMRSSTRRSSSLRPRPSHRVFAHTRSG